MAGEFEELINKATAEDLVSEAWDVNLQICDRVVERPAEEQARAKEVVGLLVRRLSHRNPNVQVFALELANSLVQNTTDTTRAEVSSRAWTGALDRLVSDRTTNPEVKKRTLKFIKEWAGEFNRGGADLGVMKDLYDGLRSRNVSFDEPAKPAESAADARARQEEEELQRVLELSKQDKGGRAAYEAAQSRGGGGAGGSGSGGGSGTAPGYSAAAPNGHHQASTGLHAGSGSSAGPRPYPAREPTPPPPPSKATASRVRAIYPFVTQERGELSFERGDVIKVLDRMYDEWYTGAVGGRIGIFPISYVEPMRDPTSEELQREAQEEARVFAAQGMIVNLQRTLDSLDPSRGDRLDDPELEEMYQKAVALQPQIVALMKKYADQKAELEHIHASFVKAQMQYNRMAHPAAHAHAQMPAAHPAAAYPGYGIDPAAGQVPQGWPAYSQAAAPEGYESYDSNASSNATVMPGQQPGGGQDPAAHEAARIAQEQHAAAWAAYYAAQAQAQQAMQGQPGAAAGGASPAAQAAVAPQPAHAAAGAEAAPTGQTQAERDHIAAWQAYYAAQAQAQAMAAQQGGGQPGYAAQPGQPADGHADHLAAQRAQQAGYAQQPGGAQHPYGGVPGATSVNSLHSQGGAPPAQQAQQYASRPATGYAPQGYDQHAAQQHTGLEHGMAQMGLQQGQGQPRQ